MVADDPFTKAIQLKDTKREERWKDALLWAKSEASTPRQRDFLKSCQEQYQRKGFLTDKQVETLFNIEGYSPRNNFTGKRKFPVINEPDDFDFDKYD